MSEIQLNKAVVFQSHKDTVSAVIIITDGSQNQNIVSVGHDGFMKMYSLHDGKLSRSVALSSVPLYSCTSYQTPSKSNVLVIGSSDNTL